MRTIILPGVPLPASAICLGTALHGSTIADDDAFALLDIFVERGGNFLDTAHIYAAWLPNGHGQSERAIGAWLRSRGSRASTVIATKGGHPSWTAVPQARLRPEDIASDLTESCERLGTDVIDLYWLHRDDPAVPVDEILDALQRLIASGRIRAIGASNWR
ncbi:MAG: aldo/keto reductase, partial [Planctomycetes bacterium]|nr:aldo/keto reductase [Planctomycetota bacterium]